MIGLQVLSRLDGPEVATVPGIVFWLLEGEGIHRHPATFQLSMIPAVDKHKWPLRNTSNAITHISSVIGFTKLPSERTDLLLL